MIDLSPEICQKLKEARRTAKLSQSVVAAEVGCKQSALSMFEQGDGTKLNEAVIRKLAEKFGVSLAKAESVPVPAPASVGERGFCPNPHCPSNKSYEVDGRTFLLPDRAAADPVRGKHCALCGEIRGVRGRTVVFLMILEAMVCALVGLAVVAHLR